MADQRHDLQSCFNSNDAQEKEIASLLLQSCSFTNLKKALPWRSSEKAVLARNYPTKSCLCT